MSTTTDAAVEAVVTAESVEVAAIETLEGAVVVADLSVKAPPKFEVVKDADGQMEMHMLIGGKDNRAVPTTSISSASSVNSSTSVMGAIPEPTGTYAEMEVMIQYDQDHDIPYNNPVPGVQGLSEEWKQGQIKQIRDFDGKLVTTKRINRALFFPDTNTMLECPLAKRDNGKRFIYASRSAVRMIGVADNVDRRQVNYLGIFFYQLSDVT